jgi:hypothetical protein
MSEARTADDLRTNGHGMGIPPALIASNQLNVHPSRLLVTLLFRSFPEAGHEIPLVVAVAVVPPFPPPPLIPPPARKPVALPLRLQLEKLLPCLPGLSLQIIPETLFHLRQKMLEMLGDRDYLRHWV